MLKRTWRERNASFCWLTGCPLLRVQQRTRYVEVIIIRIPLEIQVGWLWETPQQVLLALRICPQCPDIWFTSIQSGANGKGQNCLERWEDLNNFRSSLWFSHRFPAPSICATRISQTVREARHARSQNQYARYVAIAVIFIIFQWQNRWLWYSCILWHISRYEWMHQLCELTWSCS